MTTLRVHHINAALLLSHSNSNQFGIAHLAHLMPPHPRLGARSWACTLAGKAGLRMVSSVHHLVMAAGWNSFSFLENHQGILATEAMDFWWEKGKPNKSLHVTTVTQASVLTSLFNRLFL